MASLEEAVQRVVEQYVADDTLTVTVDSDLRDDLGLDSLDVIQILVDAEADFRVEIPNSDLDAWKTVGDVVATVRRLAPAPPPIPSDSAWQPPGT